MTPKKKKSQYYRQYWMKNKGGIGHTLSFAPILRWSLAPSP